MGVVLRAYPVRGEPHIQRNANGEVATGDGCRERGALGHLSFWATRRCDFRPFVWKA